MLLLGDLSLSRLSRSLGHWYHNKELYADSIQGAFNLVRDIEQTHTRNARQHFLSSKFYSYGRNTEKVLRLIAGTIPANLYELSRIQAED